MAPNPVFVPNWNVTDIGLHLPKICKLEEAVAECDCHQSLISLLYDSLQNVGYSKCLAHKRVWCVTMVMKGSVAAGYFSSVYSELTLGIQIKCQIQSQSLFALAPPPSRNCSRWWKYVVELRPQVSGKGVALERGLGVRVHGQCVSHDDAVSV